MVRVMRHIWYLNDWESNITPKQALRKGLRMHYGKSVHPDVRTALSLFADWLRNKYNFPLRVNVYVKEARRIKAKDGDFVVGTTWRPDDYDNLPYIRLATGDYLELVAERGRERAIIAILHTFAHELTHYYQHINGLKLTAIGEERQATIYADYVISDYSTRDDSKTGDSSVS